MKHIRGKKIEHAQQMIVRYIWDHSLQTGEKLPSCETLSEQLDLGCATIFRAAKQLQTQGILECRNKVGMFVKDARTPGEVCYNIAILGDFHTCGWYVSNLSCHVQRILMENGARGVFYSCPMDFAGINSADLDILSAAVGLRENMERGEIHGILTTLAMDQENWDYLKAKNIPCCYLGGFTYLNAPMSVTIDLEQMLIAAFERVAELGLHHPALFLPGLDTEEQILNTAFRCAERFPAFHKDNDCRRSLDQNTYKDFCDELLARPLDGRPDALICPDDEYAQKVYGYLVRENGIGFLPHPIVLGRAAALREHFPVAVDFLECDPQRIAAEGVQLILNSLRTKGIPEGPVRILATTPDFIYQKKHKKKGKEK